MNTKTRTFVGDKELFPDENGKITLPKSLQREMMKFFLRTSIPRIMREKEMQNTDQAD